MHGISKTELMSLSHNEYSSKFLALVLIVLALTSGCTSIPDPFYEDHGGIKGQTPALCNIYYENVTVVAKNIETTSSGFGSRSVYAVAVREDDIEREVANLKNYALMEVNKTYHVEEIDLKGCGYSYHYFRITGAVPI